MKRPAIALLLLALGSGLAGSGWYFRDRLIALWHPSGWAAAINRPAPQPEHYAQFKKEAAEWRAAHCARYLTSRDSKERERILDETHDYLETILLQMMDCWAGTAWDFNGTATAPGEGKIACGYFVATVLRDAGFAINRNKLAQQPSQNILLSFLPKKELKVEAGTPYDRYAQEMRGAEPGVRIVGLDHHVGFLITKKDGSFRFVHSSGLAPWCVVNESESEAASLRNSNYRVQGSLTSNREVLRRWLTGETIAVRGASEQPAPSYVEKKRRLP